MTGMFELIVNLSNAAHWHKANCHEECAVSLRLLKELAGQVANEFLGPTDFERAVSLIADIPDR